MVPIIKEGVDGNLIGAACFDQRAHEEINPKYYHPITISTLLRYRVTKIERFIRFESCTNVRLLFFWLREPLKIEKKIQHK